MLELFLDSEVLPLNLVLDSVTHHAFFLSSAYCVTKSSYLAQLQNHSFFASIICQKLQVEKMQRCMQFKESSELLDFELAHLPYYCHRFAVDHTQNTKLQKI